MDYNGLKFLVVGGSKGIGAGIVQRLCSAGGEVYATARNKTELVETEKVKFLSLDILADDLSGLAAFIPDRLNGVVYCPGTITLRPFTTLNISDFMKDLEVNYLGAIKVLKTVIPALKRSGSGSVVLFSTTATRVGMNYHASIAGAKSALEGLAISLAAEYASAHIRFNVIAPSLTNTGLAGSLLSTEEKRKAAAQRHPLKRFGEVNDPASLATFLLSPQSGWITGQIIAVDGGISALKPL